MATKKYCNLTTDITDVCRMIEEYAAQRFALKSFSLHSGSIYKSYGTGNPVHVYEDGVILTEVSSIPSIDGASKWYYDDTNDILYIHCSDDGDPDTHEIERGFDWVLTKTRARDNAQDEIDALLDARFPRPLPEARQYHTTNYYDAPLTRATALLVCSNLLDSFGDHERAQLYRNQVTNDNKTGIIDKYNSGQLRFSWEVTENEFAGHDIEMDSSNTGDGFIELYGKFGGSGDDNMDSEYVSEYSVEDEVWLIEIDGAGGTGTATFKWSRDDGTTWKATTVETDYEWITLDAGISVRFWDRNGEFDEGDKWRCYMKSEPRIEQFEQPVKVYRA
jgi:hypothetical protein